MSTERWAAVPNTRGRYEVSDQGRVRRLGFTRRTATGLRRFEPREQQPGLSSSGYPQIRLTQYRETGAPSRVYIVARLVWQAFRGPIPRGFVVAYRDGNRSNTALENLELMTSNEVGAKGGRHPKRR